MKRRSDVSDVERFISRHERVKTDGMYTSGELFDCWRITAFLGRGGSGEVYRVVNVATGEAAALKTALTPYGVTVRVNRDGGEGLVKILRSEKAEK